jgi:hypothetical protein
MACPGPPGFVNDGSAHFMSIATPSRSKADLHQRTHLLESPYQNPTAGCFSWEDPPRSRCRPEHKRSDIEIQMSPRASASVDMWGSPGAPPRTSTSPSRAGGPKRRSGGQAGSFAGPARHAAGFWGEDSWICPGPPPSSSVPHLPGGGASTPPPRWWLQGCREATLQEPEAVWAGPPDLAPEGRRNSLRAPGGLSEVNVTPQLMRRNPKFGRHREQVYLGQTDDGERDRECCLGGGGSSKRDRERCCYEDASILVNECLDPKTHTPPQSPRISSRAPDRRRTPERCPRTPDRRH